MANSWIRGFHDLDSLFPTGDRPDVGSTGLGVYPPPPLLMQQRAKAEVGAARMAGAKGGSKNKRRGRAKREAATDFEAPEAPRLKS